MKTTIWENDTSVYPIVHVTMSSCVHGLCDDVKKKQIIFHHFFSFWKGSVLPTANTNILYMYRYSLKKKHAPYSSNKKIRGFCRRQKKTVWKKNWAIFERSVSVMKRIHWICASNASYDCYNLRTCSIDFRIDA